MKLFFSERLGCSGCHAGFNLSGAGGVHEVAPKPVLSFNNTGLYDLDGKGAYPADDRGLMDMTQKPADMGRFRAPDAAQHRADRAVHARRQHRRRWRARSRTTRAGGKGPLKAPQLKGFAHLDD